MPTEGQTATGPNGQKAVYRGGQWVVVPQGAPAPVTLAPGNPVALPQAQADLERTGVQNTVDIRTLGIREREAGIAASKEQREAEDAANKRERSTLASLAAADNVLSTIRKARGTIRSGANVTGWSGALASLPGTEARALRGDLETIRSNLSIDAITQMRQNSPTGAAMGNSSDTDMRLLGATVANLDNLESASEVLDALDRIERHYTRLVTNLNGFDPDSDAGRAAMSEAFGSGAFELGDASSMMPSDNGEVLTPEQQRMIEAFYKANPNFTADQLTAFAASVGIPPITNAAEIVAAREQGRGLAPPARATANEWEQSRLGQGVNGANAGIASVLGLPVDALTGAINLTTGGMNWLNEAIGGNPAANLPKIERPVGGSDWMADKFSDMSFIREAPQTEAGAFWNRVGQSVGAAAVPGLGAARTPSALIASLLSGTGGGLGAATMQEQFPDNPAAEFGGEVVGALLGGGPAAALAARNAREAAREAVPSVDDLKQAASDLYDQADARGVVANSQVTTDLARDLTDLARREALISQQGYISEAYPKLRPVLRTLQDEAGATLNPKRIQVLRETLADAAYTTEGKEQKIARDMLRVFDDATVPLAPELADARDVASRYLQSRPIDEAIALAGSREGQFTQSGWDNALRTDFSNLMRQEIRGSEHFNPQVTEAIQRVAIPQGPRAVARWAGRFSPTGGGGIFLGGLPGGASAYAGEPVLGALLSGGLYGIGAGGRAVAGRLAQQEAQDAALMARSGGTLSLPGMTETNAADTVASALAGQTVPYTTPEDRDAFVAKLLADAQFAQ